jgi:hypothetical protein
MSLNWLYLYEGNVVYIINQDETPAPEDYADGIHDTIAMDHSLTFKVGDAFTPELQLEYNREIWIEMGWISANTGNTVPVTPGRPTATANT